MCYKNNSSNENNIISTNNNEQQEYIEKQDDSEENKNTNMDKSDDTEIEEQTVKPKNDDKDSEIDKQEDGLDKDKKPMNEEELGDNINNSNENNEDNVTNNGSADSKNNEEQNKDESDTLKNIVDNKYFTFNIPKGWKQIKSYINKDAIGLQKTNKEGIDIVKIPMKGASKISIDKYKDMLKETFTTRPGVKLNTIEVKDSSIGKIVYVEATTTITKEIMESNIEQGLITREAIESSGGMEIYEGGLTTEEIGVYQLDGESITAISGKVLKGGNKSETLKKIQEIIDNIVIK